jgi:hypothetical protein
MVQRYFIKSAEHHRATASTRVMWLEKRGADSRGVWRRQSATKGLHGSRSVVAVQGFEPRTQRI